MPLVIDASAWGLRFTTRWSLLDASKPAAAFHFRPHARFHSRGKTSQLSDLSFTVLLSFDEKETQFPNRRWRALKISMFWKHCHRLCFSFLVVDDEAPICHRIGLGTCEVVWRDERRWNGPDWTSGLREALDELLEPSKEFHLV